MSTIEVPDYEGVAAPQTGQVEQNDFSGGWNSRDAPSQVEDNESPDCINMSLDERGGAVKRLGLSTIADALAGVVKALFIWESENLVCFQIGDTLYTSTTFSAVSAIKTFSTDDLVGMCDFLSQLVIVHPQDGVFVYTTGSGILQTTGSPNNMDDVKGSSIAVWQNACWVLGDLRDGNNSRVWRSGLADPTTWDTSATGNWVDIRELDDFPLTAFSTQGGEDVVGRPGLILCKDHSVYRINDPETMGYTTLHAQAGAAGPKAITDLLGVTCMVNSDGIWTTDGTEPPVLKSEKIQPLFSGGQLDPDQIGLCAAGVKQDRVLFSLPRLLDGATPDGNNFTLEYHPLQGWIVPHDFGCAAFAQTRLSKALYGVSPTAGKAFDVFTGGSDDGADIEARYQTKWFVPTRLTKNRWRRLRLAGRGSFDLYVRRDYTLGQGDLVAIDLSPGVAKWNDGSKWNDPGLVWGPSAYEGVVDLWSLGVAKGISLTFRHTGSSSSTGPKLLEDGSAAEVGAFAVYGLELDFIKLGAA